jgi:hypothetical protein
VALASAHPRLHGSANMENRTKASTATLRTLIAIAATSMVESGAMRHIWWQSSGSVDPDHAASSLSLSVSSSSVSATSFMVPEQKSMLHVDIFPPQAGAATDSIR